MSGQQLLIASKFRRPKAAITLRNGDGSFRDYFFLPVDPLNPESEHVALVDDPAHIARLLSITEGYHVSTSAPPPHLLNGRPAPSPEVVAAAATAALAAQAAATPPPEPTPAKVAPPLPIEGTGPIEGHTPAAAPQTAARSQNEATAVALLALQLKAFKASIVKATPGVLAAALLLEDGKSEVEKRPTYIKALNERMKLPAA